MIKDVLTILQKEINTYLKQVNNNTNDTVVLQNVARYEDSTLEPPVGNKVILSLLSAEEESTMKNKSRYEIIDGRPVYRSTPAYLNLYVIFAANRTNYGQSLVDISNIIEFFQEKPVFTNNNVSVNITNSLVNEEKTKIKEFKFTVDLHSLRFEQLSYAWGVLGGKAMPSAMYKISVVKLQKEETKVKGGVVSQITQTTKNK